MEARVRISMGDCVTRKMRSEMMRAIRGKDTRPELIVRSGLHRRGFRFRLHDPTLPGKPDMKLPKFNAVIEVRGCFWHLHECRFFKWPSTRPGFWRKKLEANRGRDQRTMNLLKSEGFRVLEIWECALREKSDAEINRLLDLTAEWLCSDDSGGVFEESAANRNKAVFRSDSAR